MMMMTKENITCETMDTRDRTINRLPLEVLRRVANLLNKQDALRLCYVSKRFKSAANQRLYRSVVFVDHQYELHLLTLKKYYNQKSLSTTVLANEGALEMLLNSLKYINRDNQRFIKEFKVIVSVDSSSTNMERKIQTFLSLRDVSLTLLMVPMFKKSHLCFDASCLRWLSVGEFINSAYDRDTTLRPELYKPQATAKLKAKRLEMLHIRSCNEDFFAKVIQDIDGLDAVKSLRLSGTCVDDDYQQYPNHLEEMANMFVLSHNMKLLNNDQGFIFKNLKHLTAQKFQFAKTPYRKWSREISFLCLEQLESLALLNCKHDGADAASLAEEQVLNAKFGKLVQLVYEHSSIISLKTICEMDSLERFHMSKGGMTFNEVTKLIRKMKNLQKFSMNDSKLIRDFHRIFNSHRESNVIFSRRFLNDYQFQPTQPVFKYSEEELDRLLNCYKITTDYFASQYDNDVDPFYDIYFNDQSFINRFLKETFKPFKEDIESKILPIAECLFQSNPNLNYVKVSGIGFKVDDAGHCYVDV